MTTIAYDRSVLDLVDALSATGHVTHRRYNKKSVTIHHNAGRLSHRDVLRVWQYRPASAHFNVDSAGTVAQYVHVQEYAWAVGSTRGNCETISIEMCNLTTAPNWVVAEATWKAAARLAGWLFAKVIKDPPSLNNFFRHKHWSSTSCAGPYIDRVWLDMLVEAKKAYLYFKGVVVPPTHPSPGRKSNAEICAEVWAGKWGNGDDRLRRLTAAGYDANLIQRMVNSGVGRGTPPAPPAPPRPGKKSIATLATEVIAGKWGNGDERKRRLTTAGYDANAVQAEVNRRINFKKPKKSIATVATEVIAGKWGNGDVRRRRLIDAGYDADAVQAEVNRRL